MGRAAEAGRSLRATHDARFAALAVVFLAMASLSSGTEVAQYGGTYTGWPAEDQWVMLRQSNGPFSDPMDKRGTNPPSRIDFVGDATDPCGYRAVDSAYLYFRIRVDESPAATYSDTIYVMIDINGDSLPDFAFAWDSYTASGTDRGLEMQVFDKGQGVWNTVAFKDVDGSTSSKLSSDINGGGRTGEGYVRTVDGVNTANFGTTTFVDFAISRAYLQTYVPTLWAASPWRLAFAAVPNKDDHSTLDASGDIAGGGTPTGTINIGWTDGAYPTAVAVSGFGASAQHGRVVAEWETASELGTAGFYLERLNEASGKYQRVSSELVPALLQSPEGGTYRLVDPSAKPGETYTYRLVEVETSGRERSYGPYRVTVAEAAGAVGLAEAAGELAATGYSRKARRTWGQGAPGVPADEPGRRKGQAEARALRAKAAVAAAPGAQPAVKITVRETGLYYVSAAEIAPLLGVAENGLRPQIRNGMLSLSCQGKAVRYLPAEGGTGLYFFGQPVAGSIYTDSNVYWLRHERGLLMATVGGSGAAADAAPGTFRDTVHAEVNRYPATGLFTDPEADFWLWDYVVAGDRALGSPTFRLAAPDAAGTGTATLTVRLKGATQCAANPNHHVVVSLNGTPIGEGRWGGTDGCTLALSVGAQLLVPGDNLVTVTGLRDAGVPYSIFYVDAFDLAYPRLCRAVDDSLLCRAEGDVLTIEGFSGPAIWVFDVTAPLEPAVVDGTSVEKLENLYRVSLSASAGSAYLAVAPAAVKTPVSVELDVPSRLTWRGNQADYVVVAPGVFLDGAEALASYRRSQGLKAVVVDLEDIYDEFNHGIADPHAIQTFLALARGTWKTGPRYAVLAGHGTFDYKDYLGYGDNLIPPLLVATDYGLFAADTQFAPDAGFAVGRLPAATAGELATLVGKIIAYEAAGGPWTKSVVLAADQPDRNAGQFPQDSDDLGGLVPAPYDVSRFYLPQMPLRDARAGLLNALNRGAFLLNYIGHGGMDRFASDGLLTVRDAGSLSNGSRLPVVTAFTCIAGRFEMPGYRCLGLALVLQDGGGGIAFWGPTGMSENSAAKTMGAEFFRHAFAPGPAVLGDVALKASAVCPPAARLYQLLGDPALRLRR